MNASRMRVGVAVILYAAVLGSPLAWTQGPSPTKHPETKELLCARAANTNMSREPRRPTFFLTHF